MQIKNLIAFAEVYKYRSINRAAQNLYITPQGLSKILHRLEKDLDVILFTRTQQGVTPTFCGDVLYERVVQILGLFDSLYKDIKQVGRQRIYPLRIATTNGVIPYLTIDFLNDFRAAHPDIELEISEGPDELVDDKLWTEKSEIGFLAAPINLMRYESTFFSRHYHCLIINREHPLARKEKIDYSDLDGEPLALIGRQFMPYHNNMNRFMRAGVIPKIVLETSEIENTQLAATANKAIGLSVDFMAFANPYTNTVIRPFADESCFWEVCLVSKVGTVLSKEALLFKNFVLDWKERNQSRLFGWNPYGGCY